MQDALLSWKRARDKKSFGEKNMAGGNSKYIYLFDVDGTLTEPRKPIGRKHQKIISRWLDYPSAKGRC